MAIANNSLYRICLIREGNDYTETCKDKKPDYNPVNSNNCEGICESKIFLRPNDMCIENCDTNLFYKIENDCYLCKDIPDGKTKYKLINSSGCLENKLNYSHFINENLKLIVCDEGFEYDVNNNDSCLCINRDYFIENNTCVPNCSENYFSIGKICEQCYKECKTCENNSNNCTSCEEGKYLDNSDSDIYSCNYCTNNCKTCQKGEEGNIECLTCNNGTYYLSLNKSCVFHCPDNMNISNNECVEIEEEKEEKEEEKEAEEIEEETVEIEEETVEIEEESLENEDENDNKKNKYMNLIYIILIALFLILVILCIYKRYCRRKNSEDLIEEINTEIVENKALIDE